MGFKIHYIKEPCSEYIKQAQIVLAWDDNAYPRWHGFPRLRSNTTEYLTASLSVPIKAVR